MDQSHDRKIAVIGLGYVGLPVALAFGDLGPVVGFDLNSTRIKDLKKGIDRTNDVSEETLKSSTVIFTCNEVALLGANFYIISVPTPINNSNTPDLSFLKAASRLVAMFLRPGDIVVYESTVYPGVTEDECIPVLEAMSNLKWGTDFNVGYSPERINPGDNVNTFKTIRKIVAGDCPETLDIIAKVYESVVTAGVCRVPSIKVAEAAKVIENTQRDLNISLMNELSVIFNKMDIDTADVLAAAGSKWNFLPFTPGLVGGHCIGVDPYYLTYKATLLGYTPQVILSGRSINDGMGNFIATQTIKKLIQVGKQVKGSVVTILGVTFKENVSDIRNTRVIDIVKELTEYGVIVQVYDPIANSEEVFDTYGFRTSGFISLANADAVILAVPHQRFLSGGWKLVEDLLKGGRGLVVDVKSVLDRSTKPAGIDLWRL